MATDQSKSTKQEVHYVLNEDAKLSNIHVALNYKQQNY
jgi:hypothetical protein